MGLIYKHALFHTSFFTNIHILATIVDMCVKKWMWTSVNIFFLIVKGFDSFYGSNLYLYKVKVYNLLFLCSFWATSKENFGPYWVTSVHSIHFCPFRTILSIQSNLVNPVHFGSIWSPPKKKKKKNTSFRLNFFFLVFELKIWNFVLFGPNPLVLG